MDAWTQPAFILDTLPRGVLVTDSQWRVQYVNRAVSETLACAAGELTGKTLPEIAESFGGRDQSGEAGHFVEKIIVGPPETVLVQTVVVRVPERKFLRITVQRHATDAGTSGYVFLIADVTHQGEVEEMKNEFISVASHEMRTPMTSIKGSLELLLGGYAGELPDEATELLGISLTAVDRLVRLINDLLDISKIESGKMEFHLEPMDMNDIVRKSMRSLRSLAEAHRVSIQAEYADTLPTVLADRDHLEQVITNLLSNALKYSPADSQVSICVSSAPAAARVTVSDQGPGIALDQRDRVFDRFTQLHGAKKGTGLGLTICRAIVQEHGGRIWVESKIGHGAQFIFELPAASD